MTVFKRSAAGLALLLLAACANENRDVTLAFSIEEPAPRIAAAAQSQLTDDGFNVLLAEGANPADIFASIQDQSMDLGIVEEPNHPIPGVVTIAPLYPSVLHVLHNSDSEPDSFVSLIRGANIYAGPSGGAADRLIKQLAVDTGVPAGDYTLLAEPWTIKPDVYFIFGGLLSQDSIEQLSGYRLFSFADDGDMPGGSVADAIVLKHHNLKTFLLPKGTYYALSNKPVTTLSIRTVMIAHEDFPADVAFDIATNLFNNAQVYSLDYPLVMRELNTRFDPTALMFPLHTGSRRFVNRDEPGFVERYVDVIALVFTLLVAVGSGLFTLYRRHQQIKKDRVDAFYSELIVIREESEGLMQRDGLGQCRQKALAVQQEVLQLLVDERVSADASLLAFLSLSNQIINELNQKINYADDSRS